MIPLIIRGFLGLERANRIVLPGPVKIAAVAPRMAEHTIQNNADPLFPRRFDQMMERFICAKNRIDFVIIAGIIMMIAFRFENRIQINNGNAQFTEIIQLFLDSLQIAAKKSYATISFVSGSL